LIAIKVDVEKLVEHCKEHPHKKHAAEKGRQIRYGSWRRDEDASTVSKYRIPKSGINSQAAYQLLHDEMALDGNPLLNLAS
jgi:glutamate decarboxylase